MTDIPIRTVKQTIDGAVHRQVDARFGPNREGDEDVVELRFTYMNQHTQIVVIDETTASTSYVQLREWATKEHMTEEKEV